MTFVTRVRQVVQYQSADELWVRVAPNAELRGNVIELAPDDLTAAPLPMEFGWRTFQQVDPADDGALLALCRDWGVPFLPANAKAELGKVSPRLAQELRGVSLARPDSTEAHRLDAVRLAVRLLRAAIRMTLTEQMEGDIAAPWREEGFDVSFAEGVDGVLDDTGRRELWRWHDAVLNLGLAQAPPVLVTVHPDEDPPSSVVPSLFVATAVQTIADEAKVSAIRAELGPDAGMLPRPCKHRGCGAWFYAGQVGTAERRQPRTAATGVEFCSRTCAKREADRTRGDKVLAGVS